MKAEKLTLSTKTMSGNWWSYLRIESLWIFKVKTNADGSFERCKARLVAQEYSQKDLIMTKLLVLLYDRNLFAL